MVIVKAQLNDIYYERYQKMQITASMVKELREKTGAGMMDCKTALSENGGDFEKSVDWLRKKGISKADKKASRVAAEGLVTAVSNGTKGVVLEVNAETDFVAKNELFANFVKELANRILETGTTDVDAINNMEWESGKTVAEYLKDLIAQIGENMNIRRAQILEVSNGIVKEYIHMGGKIGVLVAIESTATGLDEIAKGVAMHVAASNPAALDRDSLDPTAIERERAIFEEQARAGGKPDNIVEKIVEGRVNKYYEESCLTEQAFVMDTDRKVAEAVTAVAPDAKITGFIRLGLGEGIEKKEDDFAAEVAAAVAS
jgi:elongation factor Ts